MNNSETYSQNYILPTIDEIEGELCRRSLSNFVKYAWPIVEQKRLFIPNWHIDAICEHLEAVSRRDITRLLITMPPRMLKSTLCSVMWPSWTWTFEPSHRFLCATYGQNLSRRDSMKMRRVVESDWYKRAFGQTFVFNDDQNTKDKFENDKTGFRLSTSIGGASRGEGGDTILIDDPHKATEIHSETKRQSVIDWWREEMSTRLNDQNTGAIVVIMQRLHESDLAGWILENEDYEHLLLPLEYVSTKRKSTIIGFDDPRTVEGELLFPERINEAQRDVFKKKMGSIGYSGQMQQDPMPAGGNIIRTQDLRYYKTIPEGIVRSVIGFDLSFEAEETSDHNVGMHIGRKANDFYLMPDTIMRGLYNFPQAMFHVERYIESVQGLPKIKIEKKANGHAAIQMLRKKYSQNKPGQIPRAITEYSPEVSKEERLYMVQPYFEAGNVWFPDPDQYPWVAEVIKELLLFPKGKYDDCVDVLTMCILDLISSSDSQFESVGQRKYG